MEGSVNGAARGDSASNGAVGNGENALAQVCVDGLGKGNLEDEVLGDLDDFEEYWEDINDRITISRMVSDSVIKGMVSAVEQEASEKELEVTAFKELLQSHKIGGVRFGEVRRVGDCGKFSCSPGPCVQNGNTREELHALRNLAIEQLVNVKKEIEFERTSNSLRKTGPEWIGLGGGILPEKQRERWAHIDKMLGNLEKTMDSVCTKVDGVLLSSGVSLCELQQDQDILVNLEGIVIESVLKRFKEEFEEKLLQQNMQFSKMQRLNWVEKFHELLSNVCAQLDVILKSLSIHDSGLVYHGSHDLDQLHQKVFNNHVTPPTSLFGENGKLDASIIPVAEIYDFQQLKHLSREEMVGYFNDIITKMKRDHESTLHQKTEEYFCLKRQYLNDRSSFVTHRKDEEFDALRKKIPEVITKLEDFLLENQQLRESLDDKENEAKHLEAQVAGVDSQLLQHSLSKEAMLKLVENLNSTLEESQIEASLKEEVFKCALRDQIAQAGCDSGDKHLEFLVNQEICDDILREAVIPAISADKYEIEDSEIESLASEGFCGLIYAEAMKDANKIFSDLSWEDQMNKNIISCLEAKAHKKENELSQVVEEKEKLEQEMLDFRTAMEQKEKLANNVSISLSKERELFAQASQELVNLRQHASRQDTLVTKSNQELQLLRSENLKALEQIQVDKIEMLKLSQMLDQMKELSEINKKEVEMVVSGLSKMFDDFEYRVSGAIKKNGLRLEDTRSQLKTLNGMANALKKTGLRYKQKLKRRFSDLQMAEAEVDLLGDEVDALLRLLEKIYIALDHYSPILKHYPGITEILKLVRRELTGESTQMS